MKRTLATAIAAVLVASTASGCTSGSASGQVLVFAASSLTGALTQIGKDFEAANPGTKITFNFGPSDALAAQIASEGAADVFVSASPTWMDAVAKDPGVTDRRTLAHGRLVVITPAADPAGLTAWTDVAAPGVQLVLAAPGVPAGDYAREVLRRAGILQPALANLVSNEEDDASVVAKITSGEADAAIVYASDLSGAGDAVRSLEIPASQNVLATYEIAVVNGAGDTGSARRFEDFATGGEGRSVLGRFGFETTAASPSP